MLVHFDFTSGVPLYRQLRDQIVLGLAVPSALQPLSVGILKL